MIRRPAMLEGLRTASLIVMTIASACNARPVDDDPIPAEVRAYAHARCLRIEQCECTNATYDDPEQCEGRIIEIYQEWVEGREGIRLGCFGAGVELWRTGSCDDLHGDAPCNAVTPHDGVGAPCLHNPFRGAYVHVDSCAEGLACAEGYCVEPVDGQVGDPCTSFALCEEGLTCMAGRCQVPPIEGQACETSWNCDPPGDLYCADGLCTLRHNGGGECLSGDECRSGTPCVDGKCTPIEPFLCIVAEL